MAEEFTPIESQEALDAIVNEKVNEAKAAFKDWTSPEDSAKVKSEYDGQIAQLNEQITTLTAEKKASELNAMKLKIAAEMKISDLADRLNGDNEKDLRADAEKLSKLVHPIQPTPRFNGDQSGKGGIKAALSDMLRSINNN